MADKANFLEKKLKISYMLIVLDLIGFTIYQSKC